MTNDEELNVPTTTQKSTYETTHIRQGTYALRLTAAEFFKDDKGQWIKPEYGQRVKLSFDVYKIAYDEDNEEDHGTVTKQVTMKRENIERDVSLSVLVNVAYAKSDFKTKQLIKDAQGNPIFETALKPTSKGMSKPAKLFMALGWKGPDNTNTFSISSLLGNWAQGSVSDFQPKDKDGNDVGEVQSQIVKDSLSALSAVVPKELNTPIEKPFKKEVGDGEKLQVMEDNVQFVKIPDDHPKLLQFKEQLANGEITQKGYDLAIKSIAKTLQY